VGEIQNPSTNTKAPRITRESMQVDMRRDIKLPREMHHRPAKASKYFLPL
jgi:hypothetical protein